MGEIEAGSKNRYEAAKAEKIKKWRRQAVKKCSSPLFQLWIVRTRACVALSLIVSQRGKNAWQQAHIWIYYEQNVKKENFIKAALDFLQAT